MRLYRWLAGACVWLSLLGAVARAASWEVGGGFVDHGVATPISQHRGMVATVDGAGRDVVLVWLYDYRGGYALLMIDAETGKAEEFPTPYPWRGDGPFASLLSSGNKYYTHFGSHFSEFDPVKRAFTFFGKSAPQMAMSLTEADDGTIWAATYPNSGLVAFNPKTRIFKDHGSMNTENWLQYPRSVAVDDAGWVYVGIGSASAQVVVFDPATGKAQPALGGAERGKGSGVVSREMDGKVYAQIPGGAKGGWREFYRGEMKVLDAHPAPHRKPAIAGAQDLFHRTFPGGKVVKDCDTVTRKLTVLDPKTGQAKTVAFDYTSEGAHIVAVAAAPDGSISGGTSFPMRMFSYAPKADAWKNGAAYGQFNTVVREGDHFFVGGYPHGFLLEWAPGAAWVHTDKGNAQSNARFLTDCDPTIYRPHDLLALADGRTVVMAGTPAYGYTGGGLLFWDRVAGTRTLLEHTDLLPELSTMSLVVLPGGRILGGTTTAGGTGGEAKAKVAELYVLDVATKRIEWHAAVFPGVTVYTDLTEGPRGLIYGFAGRGQFFVFDPVKHEVVHTEELTSKYGGIITGQGPRALVRGAKDVVYVLFAKGIARIDPATFAVTWLAAAPVAISSGGDVLGGRIYYGSGSHLYSYPVPE